MSGCEKQVIHKIMDTQKKARIFISYKRVDKDRVFELKKEIENETGEKCWIDLDGIDSDAYFASVIATAICNTDVFLFMYSAAHANVDIDKDWTVRELNLAEKRGKRIVFINIDQTPLTDWFELLYGMKQHVDATDSNQIDRLCKDLCKWLGTTLNDIHPFDDSKQKAQFMTAKQMEKGSACEGATERVQDEEEQRRKVEEAKNKHEYAIWLFQNKQFEQAELIFVELLEFYHKLATNKPMEYNKDFATLLNNTALLYSNTRRYSKAEEYFKQSLSIRQHLASDASQEYNPDVALSLTNLAILYSDTGRVAQAEEHYKQSIAIYQHLAANCSHKFLFDVAKNQSYLALVYVYTKSYQLATDCYRQALEIYQQFAKDDSERYSPYVDQMMLELKKISELSNSSM